MNIHVLCVGTLREPHWRDAADEYCKRLRKYCTLTIDDVKEERAPERLSPAEEDKVKEKEGTALLRRLSPESYAVALDLRGDALSSPELAEKLASLPHEGKSHVSFIIGGSLGLSEAVLARADLRLSFSRMTFPHQLMRIVLLEQIYRSFKILRNETYHK
ncbi:MAG: 23S rRNA (pseudouridine(1915)-N(3))-methyltransferase RlmH [Clostridiales Family XIII bacterium]|jgi:23S rRNA (pseudouridine1915-N3)-methyltransferase|nr:23S rRNA (pseudouridine(1915)-N(3))-methyltransferase RlmH [Clostridiales Family XIII bacterium]